MARDRMSAAAGEDVEERRDDLLLAEQVVVEPREVPDAKREALRKLRALRVRVEAKCVTDAH